MSGGPPLLKSEPQTQGNTRQPYETNEEQTFSQLPSAVYKEGDEVDCLENQWVQCSLITKE